MDSYKLHWEIIQNIYSKNSKDIYVVKNVNDPKDIMILKTGKDVEDELHLIRYYQHRFVNSTYFNLNFINRIRYWDTQWFIMNKYDCNLSMDMEFSKKHMYALVEDIIEALKSIHIGDPALAHMDIKLQNILIDKKGCRFKLSDYELMEKVEKDTYKLSEESIDKILYYLSRGIRLDDELVSFKTDLLCFGDVLWRILKNKVFTYLENECERLRREIVTDADIQEMGELQDKIYEKIPEELSEYYEMVFSINSEWNPTEEYYEDLKKCLWKGISK